MSDIQFFQPQESPFDSIRQFDSATGQWFWSARDLMPLLGYQTWQKFLAVIEAAQENVESAGEPVPNHFLTVELKTQGRPAIDVRLSRFACYHVALCCDSRGNTSVKAAKTYFVVKTREAELALAPSVSAPQLPPHVVAVEKARSIREIYDSLDDQPRLAQFLVDFCVSDLMSVAGQNLLEGSPTLRGVVEIAQQLGFKVSEKNRAALGKFVKSQCADLAKQEERLVNGTMRGVACYPENDPRVIDAIRLFFEN